MFNEKEFKKAINENGLKIGYVIKKVGISRQAFSEKRKGKIEFKAREIQAISECLSLTNEQVIKIFFAK